jgi:hypothetical protein
MGATLTLPSATQALVFARRRYGPCSTFGRAGDMLSDLFSITRFPAPPATPPVRLTRKSDQSSDFSVDPASAAGAGSIAKER